MSDPLIGISIDGRYKVDSLIGKGGMGFVYRATRLLIGDEVAIKILHTDHTSDPTAAERFQREARAAARLKHPNAVSIYDFGVSKDGKPYLVMELLEGESLRDFAKREGPLGLSLISEITRQVCEALDEAHRCNIIHRDIKPDNLILNKTPAGLRVKVLDFGIAKLRDESASHLTQTGSVMGTPHYMSPEQCLGEELDPRSDIYSVGIIVYEMLCGRVPFNAPVSTAVVVQQVSQPPPSIRSINPSVPPEIEAVVFRALEKNRNARPSTAAEFSHHLTRALVGSSVPLRQYLVTTDHPSNSPAMAPNETTVERLPIGVDLPSEDLPKTVHLSTPSSGFRSNPTTVGSSPAAITLTVKHKSIFTHIGVSLIAVVVLGIVVYWLLTNAEEKAQNANFVPAAEPTEGSRASPESSSLKPAKVALELSPMVKVDGGKFKMGSYETQTGIGRITIEDQNSKPAHMITVGAFLIDIYEVTCEEYKRFMDETNHRAPEVWKGRDYPPGSAKHPVTGVAWEDADAFARWAGKRLPKEEEWEFAARGPKGLVYPWGDEWREACANAANDGSHRGGMVDVGTYRCDSLFGVFDMIGNAWEWTASDWKAYPGGKLTDLAAEGKKVVRGGSWRSSEIITASFRFGWKGPGDEIGFRCVKDLPN